MMQHKRTFSDRALFILLAVLFFIPGQVLAEELTWPQEISAEQGTVLIYQPQFDTLEKDTLSGRAAVSLSLTGEKEPVFGTIWLVSRVDTDRESRIVTLTKVRVPRVRFTGSTPAQESKLSDLIEESVAGKDFSIDLDRLLPMLELAEKQGIASQNLSTAPPTILYKKEATVLISIDGKPQFKDIENSTLQRVVNTPFLIVTDKAKATFYIYASENGWYTSASLDGSWKFTTSAPAEVAKLAPEPAKDDSQVGTEENNDIIPTLLVVTEPAELISTQGEAAFSEIANTSIHYVTNTDNTILRDKAKQYYVLLSGRWYTGAGLNGPWKYVASDKLPEDFKKIPEDSELADIRYAIAGTDEAREAVLDAYIPQTAKVERAQDSIQVNYDGQPQFKKIPGTALLYAVNSEQQVLQAGTKYYACVDAVWYVAAASTGPWQVATERPEGVEEIPPESPVYNVKYVYIYDVQPDVVYVGYLPGYTGTYVYSSTVFYGTGYYYSPWYHHYYYPRPATWNVSVRYSSWGGWSFGLGYSTGRLTFGIGFGSWSRWHGGYWGPAPYRGYNRGYHRGYHHGYNSGYRAGARAGAHRSANIYRAQNRAGIHTAQNRAAVNATRRATAAQANRNVARNTAANNARSMSTQATQRKNDMYSDAKGNVYRRKTDGSWQQQGQHQQARQAVQSQRHQPVQRSSSQQQNLNRAHQAREQGARRSQQHSSSRSHSRPAGGGGGRGGGRR